MNFDFKQEFKFLSVDHDLIDGFIDCLLSEKSLSYVGVCQSYNETLFITINTPDKINFGCYFWYPLAGDLFFDWLNGYQLHVTINGLKEFDIIEYKNFLNLMKARQLFA